jgi:hypothetical protein
LIIAVSSPHKPSATGYLSSFKVTSLILTATWSPFSPGYKFSTLVLLYSVFAPLISILFSSVIFPHLSTDNLCYPANISDFKFLKATTASFFKTEAYYPGTLKGKKPVSSEQYPEAIWNDSFSFFLSGYTSSYTLTILT